MNQGNRVGFNSVQHSGAARHAAGVPVFELPACDQDHGVIGVRAFVGRNDVGRHKACASCLTRKTVNEDHRLTRVTFMDTGVGHSVLAVQPFPCDAANTWHGVAHLIKDFAHMLVLPVQTESLADLLNDPQVLPGVPGWFDGLSTHLYQAVGVGETAVFFREGAGRQDHIGQVSSLCQKDVLDHQVLQCGQGLARVVGVGV